MSNSIKIHATSMKIQQLKCWSFWSFLTLPLICEDVGQIAEIAIAPAVQLRNARPVVAAKSCKTPIVSRKTGKFGHTPHFMAICFWYTGKYGLKYESKPPGMGFPMFEPHHSQFWHPLAAWWVSPPRTALQVQVHRRGLESDKASIQGLIQMSIFPQRGNASFHHFLLPQVSLSVTPVVGLPPVCCCLLFIIFIIFSYIDLKICFASNWGQAMTSCWNARFLTTGGNWWWSPMSITLFNLRYEFIMEVDSKQLE